MPLCTFAWCFVKECSGFAGVFAGSVVGGGLVALSFCVVAVLATTGVGVFVVVVVVVVGAEAVAVVAVDFAVVVAVVVAGWGFERMEDTLLSWALFALPRLPFAKISTEMRVLFGFIASISRSPSSSVRLLRPVPTPAPEPPPLLAANRPGEDVVRWC